MKLYTIFFIFCITSVAAQHRKILDRNGDYSLYIKDSYKYLNAGDTVQLAGKYKSIRIFNIPGTVEKPIVFINKGDVTITGPSTGLAIFSGKNFKILGNGDTAFKYGIHFNSSGNISPYSGIQLENSSGVEIAFCEVANVGVGILQDPGIGVPMPNCLFHDNYLHNLGNSKLLKKGSGFIMGTMQQPLKNVKNKFENCRIESNLLENIAGDAIQLSNGEFIVENNLIKNYGLSNLHNSNAAILMGINATGKIIGNTIDSSHGPALAILGFGEIEVAKNKISNISITTPHTNIVYIKGLKSTETNQPALSLKFHHNIINGTTAGFAIRNETESFLTAGSTFSNNTFSGKIAHNYSLNSKDKLTQSETKKPIK